MAESKDDSLLRYDPPQLVILGSSAPPVKPKTIRMAKGAPLPATEDVLSTILPPRRWERDGKLWVQYASSAPATRLDVETLKEQLDLKMQQRGARETGICHVREELFNQCFDELIRQVTVACAERGLLLLRMRNEALQNIQCYQSLYESSVAFGMRSALAAEQSKAESRAQASVLGLDISDLEEHVARLQTRLQDMADAEAQRIEGEEKHHQEEVDRLKSTISHLRETLEAQLAPPQR